MGNFIHLVLLFQIGVTGLAAAVALYMMASFMGDHANIKDWTDSTGKVIPPLTVKNSKNALAPTQQTWFNAGWGFAVAFIPIALSAWLIFKMLKRREPIYPGKLLLSQVVLAWVCTLFGAIYVAFGFSSTLATFNGTALPSSPGSFNAPKAAFIFSLLFAVTSLVYALWSTFSYWSMRRRMMRGGEKYNAEQGMAQEEYYPEEAQQQQQQQHHRR